MKNILVLCTGNSCRSQIAEGYFRFLGDDRLTVKSAGVEVHGLNPRAMKIMAEDGVDISGHTSNHIDEFIDEPFDFVITVCDNARETCPYFPSKAELIHQNFPDPAQATGSEEEIMAEFRTVRDQIKHFTQDFIQSKVIQS